MEKDIIEQEQNRFDYLVDGFIEDCLTNRNYKPPRTTHKDKRKNKTRKRQYKKYWTVKVELRDGITLGRNLHLWTLKKQKYVAAPPPSPPGG